MELKLTGKIKLTLVIIGVIIITIFLGYAGYSLAYSQKIYPNVRIAGLDIGGMTKDQVQKVLQYKINSVKGQDIVLEFQDETWVVKPEEWDVKYDLNTSLESAYSLGHSQSWLANIIQRTKLLFDNKELQVAFSFNKLKLDELSEKLSQKIDQPVKDASCDVKNGIIYTTTAQTGRTIKSSDLKNLLVSTIAKLEENRRMILPVIVEEPKISDAEANEAKTKAEEIIGKNIVVGYGDQKIKLPLKDVASWLEFIAVSNYNRKNHKYNLVVRLNFQKVAGYVANLSRDINRDFKDAKLTISEGRVVVFQKSQDGLKLEQEQTVDLIVDTLLTKSRVAGISSESSYNQKTTQTISLPVEVTKAEVTEDDIDNLGIREQIGQGTTNFKGSPSNRVYNIKKGAEVFNGVIVKPGDTLSMIKHLGKIDAASGFLPELVIKNNKTTPDYGGGLCQVSTTFFRAVMNAGLPVVDRTNHSYRVSYYEPPVGMDATVYYPNPDFKFKNDTANYILIQTKVEKNDITFELYGTKDGREVTITDPEVYDYQSPGANIYIETIDLPRGETKQIEKRHTGAKAKFTYIVRKGGQEIFNRTFFSSYKAWSARYLVGTGDPKPEEQQPESQSTENQESTPAPQEQSSSSTQPPQEQTDTAQNASPTP